MEQVHSGIGEIGLLQTHMGSTCSRAKRVCVAPNERLLSNTFSKRKHHVNTLNVDNILNGVEVFKSFVEPLNDK